MFSKLYLSTTLAFSLSLAVSTATASTNDQSLCEGDFYQQLHSGSDLPRLELELNSLFSTIEAHYGPLQLKKTSIGLDWEQQKAAYLARLSKITTIKQFYFLVSDLLAGFNDAHVSITLPSSVTYSLPLQLAAADGKVVVSYIDTSNYPKSVPIPAVGDELLLINGVTPKEFHLRYPIFVKDGNSLTNLAMFALTLGHLSESRGLSLESFPDKLELTFQDIHGQKKTLQLDYKKSGLPMIDRPLHDYAGRPLAKPVVHPLSDPRKLTLAAPAASVSTDNLLPLNEVGFDQLTPAQAAELNNVVNFQNRVQTLFNTSVSVNASPVGGSGAGKMIELGQAEPSFKLPDNFKQIKPPKPLARLFATDVFYAGVFERNGKKIGYLRIGSYMPAVSLTMQYAVRYYMGELERLSDVLIIDQMNNPGGAVILSDLILKALNGRYDLSKHLRFSVKPNEGFLRQYLELVEQIKNIDVGLSAQDKEQLLSEVQGEFEKIYRAYENGTMSEPISLTAVSEYFERSVDHSIEKIAPLMGTLSKWILKTNVLKHQNYTKPVYFVVNSCCFSGGDATPASFQDYGRGKIVGVHTAGAGGTVEEFLNRGLSEFPYRLTTSLMVRKDGTFVENKGVKPDVDFTLTQTDYREGFTGVLDRLLAVLKL